MVLVTKGVWDSIVGFGAGMNQEAPRGMSEEVIRHFLNTEKDLPSKNGYIAPERNMLVLLEIYKKEYGFTEAQLKLYLPGYEAFITHIENQFMQHQLSLDGFNRRSMERMMAPEIAQNTTVNQK